METNQQQKVVQFSEDEFSKILKIAQPFLERGVPLRRSMQEFNQ